MNFKDKTILVTGGAGFIGSHIAKRLIELGARVIIADNMNAYYDPGLKKARLNKFLGGMNFKFYKCDIADLKNLEKIFKQNKVDLICHEAAQAGVRYSFENPHAYGASNMTGMLNILDLAQKYKIKGVVFASSSSVYGNSNDLTFKESAATDQPVSLYAATKKAGELLAQVHHKAYGLSVTALRYFTVYGPWGRPDMAIFKFTKAILAGEKIDVYNRGNLMRDFTYIDDIVNGTILALEKNLPFEIINLGCGRPHKLGDFIRAIEDSTGKKAKMKLLPHQKGDVLRTSANIAKAKKLLGWEPKITLAKGTKNFVDWYRDFHEV